MGSSALGIERCGLQQALRLQALRALPQPLALAPAPPMAGLASQSTHSFSMGMRLQLVAVGCWGSQSLHCSGSKWLLLKCSGYKAALLKQRAEGLLQVACLQWLQLLAQALCERSPRLCFVPLLVVVHPTSLPSVEE